MSADLRRAVAALVVLLAVGGASAACGDETSDQKKNDDAPAAASKHAAVIGRAEDAMAGLDDYTYRGSIPLPLESTHPLHGRQAASTMRVTADGDCETVISFGDGLTITRRSIGDTMYQQMSPEMMEVSQIDDATQAALVGRWTAQPDDPGSTCDMTQLAASIDPDTLRRVGDRSVQQQAAVEYSAQAREDDRLTIRMWIATGRRPLILRLVAAMSGVDMDTTLVSYNDGFTIVEPAADSVVRP